MSIVKLNLGSDATPVAAQKQTLLTLIVPVFNEQTAIGPFLDAISPILDRMKPAIATEILFVNDGSRDGTEFVIRSFMEGNASVRLVNLSRNFGKEAALCAGLEHARGDAVIPVDVDLQDEPTIIPDMVENGSKAHRSSTRGAATDQPTVGQNAIRRAPSIAPSTCLQTIPCPRMSVISACWTARSSKCCAPWASGCA